jgi:hypothetical protein
MALPLGIPMLKVIVSKNKTRVDNLFCNEETLGLGDLCTTRQDWRPVKTNYYPIITHLRVKIEKTRTQPRRN